MSPAVICFVCVAYTAGLFAGEPAFPVLMAAVVLNAVGRCISLARCSKLDSDHVGITGVISENTEWGNPKVLQSPTAWRTNWLTALGLVHVSTTRKKKQAFDKGTAGVEEQTATEAGLGNTAELLALVQ